MNIIDYCNKNELLWQPIKIEIVNGKKTVCNYGTNKKPCSNDDEELWKARQININKTEHIAIQCKNVYQADVDSSTFDYSTLIENKPYFLSSTKRLPHIFISSYDTKQSKLYTDDLVEFGDLCRDWAWCRKNEVVHNSDSSIKYFDCSIYDKKVILENKRRNKQEIKQVEQNKKENEKKIKNKLIGGINDDEITKVVNLLDPECHYDDWFKIACFFKKYLDLEKFLVYSRASSKHDEDTAISTFTSIKKHHINIGTIHYLAKQFNETAYLELFEEDFVTKVITSYSDQNIANLIYFHYSDEFKYVNSIVCPNWYQFKNHRWNCNPNGTQLEKLITTEISDIFQNKALKCTNPELIDFLNHIATTLQTTKNIGFYMARCKVLFETNEDWLSNLDENHNLLGFSNGVYDLKNKVFRDGLPSDNLTLSTDYDFTPVVNTDIQSNILNFVKDIMPNDKMVQFYLTNLAYNLSGNKYLETSNFHTGSGANGKSVASMFTLNTFGKYGYAPSPLLFTKQAQSSSSASSEKIKMKGKRILILQEPDDDEKIRVGAIKGLSDKIQARELFKPVVEFKPQCQFNIFLNIMVDLSSIDGGVKRRIKVVCYPHKFVENPINLGVEKKIDLNLESKFMNVSYYQQFILILLDYYYNFIYNLEEQLNKQIEFPDEVVEQSQRYLDTNDMIKNFTTEYYEITNDENDIILFSDFYQLFCEKAERKTKNWVSQQIKDNLLLKCCIHQKRDSFRKKNVIYGLKKEYTCALDEEIEET